MNIKERYIDLKKEYDPGKLIVFITELTKDNSPDILNFHYSLLNDKSDIKLFNSIRHSFIKRKDIDEDEDNEGEEWSKTLVYKDDKSNKFWTIEVEGDSYTVTFGKTGTNGQSQTKEFDSMEDCEKAAQKLVAEKLKKGYKEE